MTEAKLAPNLPDWMVEHANRYLASGGTDGHTYKINVPGRGEITAPALLLTTTGRKSGEKFIFPLFYGTDGDSYFVVASKGGAPEHPGWYRNILANPDVEVQVGTKKLKARARTADGRGTRATLEKGARILAALRRLLSSRPNARYRWSCWTLSIELRACGGRTAARHADLTARLNQSTVIGPRVCSGAGIPAMRGSALKARHARRQRRRPLQARLTALFNCP